MRALFIAITVAAATLSACSGLVSGNGKVQTERRTVPAYGSISVGGSGTLRVHRGPYRVDVTADSNLLQYIDTEVVGSELRIGFRPGTQVARVSRLEYDVTMPDLAGVSLSGSAQTVIDAFDGRSFTAKLSGSGDIKGELRYDNAGLSISGSGGASLQGEFGRFTLGLSGSGMASLSGSASELRIDASGSGRVDARGFTVKSARVEASGSCEIEIRAEDSIKAGLSGSGRLRYWGEPLVSASTGGSSKIQRAGD